MWNIIQMHGINKASQINFPSSPMECAELAADFETVSHRGIFKNVVQGAIDGYLMAINTPRKKQTTKNVHSYFSGRTTRDMASMYRLVVIVIVDLSSLELEVQETARTDKRSKRWPLQFDWTDDLPPGYCCVADSAYQPTESLITIFGGDLALFNDSNNFNYFTSHLRIRIDMAFGLMVTKWSILQRPLLSNSLPRMKHLICCILARLHNFCIDVRLDAAEIKSRRNHSPASRKIINYAACIHECSCRGG